MATSTFAAIDIGSYEVGMKIYELSKKIPFRIVNDIRYRLDLGSESYSVGKLSMDTVGKICEILHDFSRQFTTSLVTLSGC